MHHELAAAGRWDLLAGADIFTMFREPVDQTISLYNHMVQVRELIDPTFRANGVLFPDSLEQFAEYAWLFNTQLAFLVGKKQVMGREPLTRQDLAHAKNMLLDLQMHVGLTERYADSLHVLETVTGRRIPGRTIQTLNVNVHRPALASIPQTLTERIREQSALDAELYEFGRALLEQDLVRCGPAPTYSFNATAAPRV